MNEYLDLEIKPIVVDKTSAIEPIIYSHLPLVKVTGEWLGVLDQEIVNDYSTEDVIQDPLFTVPSHTHPLICIQRMKELNSNVVFVVDNGIYQGAFSYQSLMHYFQDHLTLSLDSAILVLEISSYQFSLADLARVVESEGNKILTYHSRYLNVDNIELTLSFQENDLKRIVGILENKGYQITNYFNETGVYDHLKARYENLLSYLNV
jgi:hypothetical protein